MKNYKLLVPFVLVVLFVLSIYMTFDSNMKADNQYNDYIFAARSFAAQGIVVDAIENYTFALEIKDSLDLQMEIAVFYKTHNRIEDAAECGREMLKSFPNRVEVYGLLMNIYSEQHDYIACFRLADTMQRRNLPLDAISETLIEINDYYFFQGQYEDVSVFGGGYCAVKTKGLWGYVNETGRRIIRTQFLETGPFRLELAPVLDTESQAYFIDTEGNKKKVVLGVDNVVKLGAIEDGVYTLFDGKTWGLYGKDDKPLAGGFDEISSFINGIAAAKRNDGWMLIDSTGQPVNSATYDHVVQDERGVVYRGERLFVKIDDHYYLIDISGNKINETGYEDVKMFYDATYAAVRIDGLWGFIDTDGSEFIRPEYKDAHSFSGGFAAVKIDDRWGFINTDNELAIENIFIDVKNFNSRGCVFISFGDEWELLKLYKYNF